jgi:hypothetical protein
MWWPELGGVQKEEGGRRRDRHPVYFAEIRLKSPFTSAV